MPDTGTGGGADSGLHDGPLPRETGPSERTIERSGLSGHLVKQTGGSVPCERGERSAPGAIPAFVHVAPRSMPLPVLIAVPHAGRAYPADLTARMRDERVCTLRLEDRHVDQLGVRIAKATGIGLLVAQAPRAMLDLNRSCDDVDWDMIRGAQDAQGAAQGAAFRSNHRARSGLGLVPRRLPGFGEIWRGALTPVQLAARIDQIHKPYHAFLADELRRIRDQWGAALLVDLHSMPPLKRTPSQELPPRLVIGDRFGASCDPRFVERAFRHLEAAGCEAAHNRPYSGGYVLDRHASPGRNIHAIQLEVCRSTYLDEQRSDLSEGAGPMAEMIAGLVCELGALTAQLADQGTGRDDFREAAE